MKAGGMAYGSRLHWLEFIAVLIAFLAGAGALMVAGSASPVAESWKVVLISAATLCVGIGVAALLYGRLQEREARALRADFQELRARADAVVAKFDKYERRRR